MNSVLVVENFVPFRAFVSTLLREKLAFQIVSEASDGLEAVRRARELSPDLILLDIGLPGLNGIEAARRIREQSATSRIVFLTQEDSTEVLEEALKSGGLGYVHKSRAGNDLVPAIATVLEGKQFVSNAYPHQERPGAWSPIGQGSADLQEGRVSRSSARSPGSEVKRNSGPNYGSLTKVGINR